MTALAERTRGRSELGVAGFLVALGAVVAWDATRISTDFATRGPVGPKAVPVIVAVLLLVTGVLLAVDVLRGGRGEMEGGEDVDLSHGTDWKTVGIVVAAFLGNALLIETLGWAVSGALLFFVVAYGLGSRRYVRDAVISVTVSVGSFYLFALGLGITLPPGILRGIL